jgi:hypothetical protein
MMKSFGLLVLGLIACLGTSPSLAADASGQYLVGGGVGGLPCTQFLNAMAEARQQGGLKSVAGAHEVYGFISYVLGFETGYNYSTPGVRDIFGAFGSDPAWDVLYGIEPWCQRNPTALFGSALIAFAESLRREHR